MFRDCCIRKLPPLWMTRIGSRVEGTTTSIRRVVSELRVFCPFLSFPAVTTLMALMLNVPLTLRATSDPIVSALETTISERASSGKTLTSTNRTGHIFVPKKFMVGRVHLNSVSLRRWICSAERTEYSDAGRAMYSSTVRRLSFTVTEPLAAARQVTFGRVSMESGDRSRSCTERASVVVSEEL